MSIMGTPVDPQNRPSPGSSSPSAGRWTKRLLPLVILAIGVFAAVIILKTAPQPKKAAPPKKIPQVRVQEIRLVDERVAIPVMGTVVPARKLSLKAQVGGEIVALHPEFVEGGFMGAGETILRIDPVDYQLLVARAESRVAEARYQLKLELGHQEVAKREWQLLGGGRPASDFERELALRRPHLDKARAEVKAAEAELEQAKVDLSRTRLTAPFNAVLLSRQVVRGSRITPHEALAELVGTDEYWVRVSVPVDRVGWFAVPASPREVGARALVRFGEEGEMAGRVIRLLGDLEEQGRMARALVSVPDPLGRKKGDRVAAPLLLGQFVQVAIEGNRLSRVARIPRTALREDDTVWIVDGEGRLRLRRVTVAWREKETLLVQGELHGGERLVLSEVTAPAEGMAVEVLAEEVVKPVAVGKGHDD